MMDPSHKCDEIEDEVLILKIKLKEQWNLAISAAMAECDVSAKRSNGVGARDSFEIKVALFGLIEL